MSHIQGTDYVGSMVVVEDGLPKKSDYRRFKIQTVAGNDDFAAMEEVLTRRFTAYLKERRVPVEEREGRFSYPPQLLVVDGGKGQLSVAVRVLSDLGLQDEIPVVSLAKQFEEVFVPGQSESIRLPRQSPDRHPGEQAGTVRLVLGRLARRSGGGRGLPQCRRAGRRPVAHL